MKEAEIKAEIYSMFKEGRLVLKKTTRQKLLRLFAFQMTY